MTDEFTLAELADRLDIQPRTIRNYIEKGLLRGPEVGGRGARYTEYHLHRLQAIRTLKDIHGLPLDEVRRRLMNATGPELAALIQEAQVAKAPGPLREAVSALDYIRTLSSSRPPEVVVPPSSAAPTPMDVLLARFDLLSPGSKPPPRRSHGQVWTSIPLTRDVEIRVRGTLTLDQLSRWERIADHLREILMGGAQEE